MPNRNHAPKSVIKRLPIYLRILDSLIRRDIEIISSRDLSNETGFTAEQIRKDLAHFGAFGTRGTGYNTVFLREKILKIIGLHKKTNVILIGAGHLGIALTRYNTTKNEYISLVAAFDNDPNVVGMRIIDLSVRHTSQMEEIIKENNIKVAIITVPADQAQKTVDELVKYGIKAIHNFAPIKIIVPDDVYINNVDLTIELQSLIYYVSEEEEEDAAAPMDEEEFNEANN